MGDDKVDRIKELELHLLIALQALILADEFFTARDEMNSKVHCDEIRLSPITIQIRDAIDSLRSI